MKLEKFQEKDIKKKVMIIGSIIFILLITVIVVYRSFALFEENLEFDVIKGVIPNQNYDLMFSFQVEDENGNKKISETIPEGRNYIIEMKCNNEAIGIWNYEEWAPEIQNLTKERTKCNILFQKNEEIDDGKILYPFGYTGKEEEFVVPYDGTYKVELWGTRSGSYTSGYIDLKKGMQLFLYIGESSFSCDRYWECDRSAFNGGGKGGYFTASNYPIRYLSGSGSTDIRLIGGEWNNEVSLNSRIMVAAGGGGGRSMLPAGGGLTGYIGTDYNNGGAGSQTAGGTAASQATSGGFGYGGNGYTSDPTRPNNNGGYGGGSGYYGGGGGRGGIAVSSTTNRVGSGGSGSSFISGHNGCVAIKSETDRTPKEGCKDGTTDINCSIHYSGYQFKDTIMIDGAGYKWTTVKEEHVGVPTRGNYQALITYILY